MSEGFIPIDSQDSAQEPDRLLESGIPTCDLSLNLGELLSEKCAELLILQRRFAMLEAHCAALEAWAREKLSA